MTHSVEAVARSHPVLTWNRSLQRPGVAAPGATGGNRFAGCELCRRAALNCVDRKEETMGLRPVSRTRELVSVALATLTQLSRALRRPGGSVG